MPALAIIPSIIPKPEAATARVTCSPKNPFPTALAEYLSACAHAEWVSETSDDNDAVDRAWDGRDGAFEKMLRTPARHVGDIAVKLDAILIEYKDCTMDEKLLALIQKDAAHLSGMERA